MYVVTTDFNRMSHKTPYSPKTIPKNSRFLIAQAKDSDSIR